MGGKGFYEPPLQLSASPTVNLQVCHRFYSRRVNFWIAKTQKWGNALFLSKNPGLLADDNVLQSRDKMTIMMIVLREVVIDN